MQQVGSAESSGLTSVVVTFEDESQADLFKCQDCLGSEASVLSELMLTFFFLTTWYY